jgi:hypothetical protein
LVRTAAACDTATNNQSAIPVAIYGGAGSDATTNLVMDAREIPEIPGPRY